MKMNTNTEKHRNAKKHARKTRPQNALAPHARPHHEVHQNPAGGKPTNRRVNGTGGGWCTSWGETPSP